VPLVLALVLWVYWPVRLGGFVWDDQLCFHDAAWLRHGSLWANYMFRGFCDWTDYFRPLVVAFYVLQVRLFDSTPGPMHLVSLGLHLVNTLLVGMLALKLRTRLPSGWVPVALCTLLYGLHPALIEPVFWIGCQYELFVTMFVLLGLTLNEAIERSWLRAAAVAASFFLAAGAKESAVAFPLLLAVFDFAATPMHRIGSVRTWMRRQWPVYLAVLGAGLLYLALRHWAIGPPSATSDEPFWSLARLHKVGLTYLSYWKLLLWPMSGLGPIHPVDEARFTDAGWQALTWDAGAATVITYGVFALFRQPPLGRVLLGVTAALFPVLHVLPIAFNESLYHERYAMTALAVACASMPALFATVPRRPALRRSSGALACLWLVLAIANIRITLPLWSDELALWQWALREYPDSLIAKQHLLAKYVEHGDRARARALGDALIAEKAPCPVCMLSIAYMALNEHDPVRASLAIDRIRNAESVPNDPLFMEEFIIAQGELFELRNDPAGAAAAYRDASRIDPLDPRPQMNLAYLLLRKGEALEARRTAEAALALFAPEERDARRQTFEQAASAGQQP